MLQFSILASHTNMLNMPVDVVLCSPEVRQHPCQVALAVEAKLVAVLPAKVNTFVKVHF